MANTDAAWAALDAHASGDTSIAALFDAEPDRLARMAVDACGIRFDFAKSRADTKALDLLADLANAADIAAKRAALFAGEVVNPTERRAATHPAERGSGGEPAVAVAAAGHAKMRALVEAVARGEHGDIRHVLHLGIGGSALGPALLLDALGGEGGSDGAAVEAAVVANIDGAALAPVLARFDPARTLVVIVSKTFGTIETMTNAQAALDWLAAAGVADPRCRCVAVTAAPDSAARWGIDEARILPFADSVGGRYSLWSAVGLPLALTRGWAAFEQLLDGARAMDAHFVEAAPAANAPLLAAMIDVWNAGVLRFATRGVFAYDERLRLLASYLQQLEMESNGKRVSAEGAPLDRPSAAVTWGGVGTDAQHAVFQLLHQGTQMVPVEFVAVIEPGHALGGSHHRQLLANCFAQGAALMTGRDRAAALAKSNGDPALAEAKLFPGNRPSTTILLDRLDPATLGSLLAFYEHRTVAAAWMLGINPFDQWGVELGKEVATAIGEGDRGGFDASTAELMRRAGL